MFYYVEHWKPRPKWLEMTPEDRGKFLYYVSPAIQELVDAGAELVGYVMRDLNSNQWADRGFLRVWKIPHREFAQRIEDELEKAGWHEFFEAGTARGEILTPQVAVPSLVSA